MTASKRIVKQVLVLTITLLVIYGFFWTGWQIFSPPTPTPTADPRLLLDPLQIISENIIEVQKNDYDFVARIYNPNTEYGGADVKYELIFQANNGATLLTIPGSFYILPGQTKYIVRTHIETSDTATQAKLHITTVDWQELNVLGQSGVDLIVTNVRYGSPENPNVFYQAGADVYNSSFFDLDMIDIVLLAFDKDNNILAVNETDMRTLLAGKQRGFETPWFDEFEGQVDRVIVEAYTNLFKNENFLKTQGSLERFQLTY